MELVLQEIGQGGLPAISVAVAVLNPGLAQSLVCRPTAHLALTQFLNHSLATHLIVLLTVLYRLGRTGVPAVRRVPSRLRLALAQ
jgi:hypothetical protein